MQRRSPSKSRSVTEGITIGLILSAILWSIAIIAYRVMAG